MRINDLKESLSLTVGRMLFGLPFVLLCALLPVASFADSFTYGQCATCGPTGGPALQIINQGLTAPTTSVIILVNTTFSVNPATITGTIDASVEKNFTISESTLFTDSITSGFRPAVMQDGIIYILNPSITGPTVTATNTTSASSGWGSISGSGLTLANFVQYNVATATFGTGNPNATDQLNFGLASIGSFSSTQIVNATTESDFAALLISDGPLLVDDTFSDLNNYQVFSNVSVSETPEPESLFVVGASVLSLYLRKRKSTLSRSPD